MCNSALVASLVSLVYRIKLNGATDTFWMGAIIFIAMSVPNPSPTASSRSITSNPTSSNPCQHNRGLSDHHLLLRSGNLCPRPTPLRLTNAVKTNAHHQRLRLLKQTPRQKKLQLRSASSRIARCIKGERLSGAWRDSGPPAQGAERRRIRDRLTLAHRSAWVGWWRGEKYRFGCTFVAGRDRREPQDLAGKIICGAASWRSSRVIG